MSDLSIDLVPHKKPLPVNDDPDIGYGELNYIFYPGYSACQQIRLNNNTAETITPHLYFDEEVSDKIWWKTLRIFPDCSGVLPSGEIDTYWEGEISPSGVGEANPSGYVDLYVRSICTKEGFSWKYEGDYWDNDGFTVVEDAINDNEEQGFAIDCDTAAAGSTLTLDTQTVIPLGTRTEEEFVRVKFSFDGTVNATFDIQYSDDDITYTTVYTGADLSARGIRRQMTFWWDRDGAHRYWRIVKTNAATAGANITEVQWLLFEAHDDAYDFGVYGDHRAWMKDSTGHMNDFEWRTSVMVNTDVFARQNFEKPIGKIGGRTKIMMKNFEKYGQTVQVYYIPAITMSYNLNAYADYQLEKRIWNQKVIISPQKRNLSYYPLAGAFNPGLYAYEERTIVFPAFGPDSVGWYISNYDFWHSYGHSYYILYDNHCYKIDDLQPVYIDNELIAFSGRMFLQSNTKNLGTDPRGYVLANTNGLFSQFPQGGYSVPEPTDWLDLQTPEQRPLRWISSYPQYIYSRPLNWTNRPNTYALTSTDSPDDGYPNGEVYVDEEWNNPQTTNFQTTNPLAFGGRVVDTPGALFYQMPRFYNWIGYVDQTGSYDVFNFLLQLYLDEDHTIPVKINLQDRAELAKVEFVFDEPTYVSAAGLVTLTALGGTIYTDGHLTRTPSKLYVRYIAEDGHEDYYY